MKDEMVTRNLDVALTAVEVAAYAKTLAIEVDNKNALEAEAKASAAAYKDSIKQKADEINLVAGKVRHEKERRDVSYKWTFDWNANTKHLFRQDTFELVETRVIEPSERQAYLQLTEEGAAKKEIENPAEA